MKKSVLVLVIGGFTSVWAQTTSNVSGTAITPSTSPILSPAQPALSPTTPSTVTTAPTTVTTTPSTVTTITSPAISPGLVTTPAVTGPSVISGGTATTNIASELTALLVNLEIALLQAEPVLAAFNNSFDFVTLGTGSLASGVTNSATNLASSLGQNLVVTNFAGNFVLSSTGLSGTISGTTSGTTNVLVVVPGFGSFPITRDTLRGLLVLQNDIQRLLPLVDALNGGTNFSTNGTVPGFGLGIINSNLAATTNTLPATQ